MAIEQTANTDVKLMEVLASSKLSTEDCGGSRSQMDAVAAVDIAAVVDSLNDGIYVCDLDRRIIYWSESAKRITGWTAEEVIGRQCFDSVLCHVDKDGHQLCGEEHCPLHRAMTTDAGSKGSLLVYAQGKEGQRIPMQVSVAPVHNAAGEVMGGVEIFQDYTAAAHDLERAKAIQQLAVQHDVPEDTRICGLVDLKQRTFRFAGAGGPEALLAHADGTHESLEGPGLPFGILEDTCYEEISIPIQEGDHLLLFSDGAVEVHNADDQMLKLEGLIGILKEQGYPTTDIQMSALEEELLKYSNGVRIDDDLTFIEIRFNHF